MTTAKQPKPLSPADCVFIAFERVLADRTAGMGKPAPVATWLADQIGSTSMKIYRWRYPVGHHGGTGGVIRPLYHSDLLKLAAKWGAKLTASDLKRGRNGWSKS